MRLRACLLVTAVFFSMTAFGAGIVQVTKNSSTAYVFSPGASTPESGSGSSKFGCSTFKMPETLFSTIGYTVYTSTDFKNLVIAGWGTIKQGPPKTFSGVVYKEGCRVEVANYNRPRRNPCLPNTDQGYARCTDDWDGGGTGVGDHKQGCVYSLVNGYLSINYNVEVIDLPITDDSDAVCPW